MTAPRVPAIVAAWRLTRVVLHVLHGVAVASRFPRLNRAGREQRIVWWSRKLLRLLGITLQAQGSPRPHACLFVANHVSWLDIIAINAVQPARFVAKSEIRSWPVIGGLVTAAGTLYIERQRARDAVRVVHDMAQALRDGDVVAVFPEGTTGPGDSVLPFHANLLQAAIAVDAPVQPMTLRYADPAHRHSPAAAYIGDTTLMQSLWMIARARGLTVHLGIQPPQGSSHADRRALAAHLREQIAAALLSQ
ncbi:MAG: 1-acyl-sn-glycerol-3-phosphate acyltransferase [Burkholderiales bacterium]|nr:1-acyl-sn-glycerol-3-phosphate acyltransferase [Burkholderiales bacterium]